jgi:hypothetical protein
VQERELDCYTADVEVMNQSMTITNTKKNSRQSR